MSMIAGASHVAISGDARLYNIQGNAEIHHYNPLKKPDQKYHETLTKLSPCFPGTRAALLEEIIDWAFEPGGSRMYVLFGLAGVGKSTVAYTVATQAAELGSLGASFFFSRDDDERNNAQRFFSTIADQLSVYNKTFANAIGDVRETMHGSAATIQDPQEQFQALILEPLRSIVQSRSRPMGPVLIVVDALDECEEDQFSVLTGLSQLADLPSFKVILTTRPQPYFDHFLDSQGGYRIFHMQDIEDEAVDRDIRLYLKQSLSPEDVQRHYPRQQWGASDGEIDRLVRAVGRVFFIASGAVRYILNKTAANPAAQMQKLLHAFAQDYTPFKDLDYFYTITLQSTFPVIWDNHNIVDHYRSVVGAIIFIKYPLPVSALAHVININVKEIRAVLDNLRSVILLGNDDVPRFYHKSMADYLTDKARCKDSRLYIDPTIGQTQIATYCFNIMNKHLKQNILGLGHPARYMNNEDGLKEDGITKEQLEQKIPQQLRYACVSWVDHLEVADIEDADFTRGLEMFVHEHILHCFEVMSLIGQLDSVQPAIGVVLKSVESLSSDVHKLLLDAFHFISTFYNIIKESALHTYYSALPFTPTDSLLYRRYKEAAYDICGIEGGPEKWPDIIAANLRLRHDDDYPARILQFSHDGTLFASCSDFQADDQGKVKVWNAVTGASISVVSGCRLAVANDFATIASSENKTISLYNMDGSAKGTVITTSSNIQNLAFSSESNRVAAALSDGTVSLWDSRNAKLIENFNGFIVDDKLTYDGCKLRFSATGTRLAFWLVNRDDTIKLRDSISGGFIADLQCPASISQFAFSDDGSRIASLSCSFGLCLWNTESGGLIGAVKDESRVNFNFAISANGSLLATTNLSQVILWGENGGNLARIKVHEIRSAYQIAFSLDNMLAIVTRSDIKIYDIKTHTFVSTIPFKGSPRALAFSPDCRRIAVGNGDGNVYFWNIQRIDASSPPIVGTAPVTALALSRDCSQLARGFADGTVELLGIGTTKRKTASWYQAHKRSVHTLTFSPDGGLFVSGSVDGNIKLWDGRNGSLQRIFAMRNGLLAVAISNSVLVAADSSCVTLWSLDTFIVIVTFAKESSITGTVSIAENSVLVATASSYASHTCISLFEAINHTTVATFNVTHHIRNLAFLPDTPHLLAQSDKDMFLSFNLISKSITEGPILNHLNQIPDIPLWHGIPIWSHWDQKRRYFTVSFPRCKSPVPVLWIPMDLPVTVGATGSSVIALGCADGRVVLFRLPTGHVC